MKLELGALRFTVEVMNGVPVPGTPCVEILQDNVAEVMPEMPDGVYRWTLVLDVGAAEVVQPGEGK